MDGLQLKAKDRKRNAEITTWYKQPVRSGGAVTSGPPIVIVRSLLALTSKPGHLRIGKAGVSVPS